jgi:hypothetical protein
MRTARRPLIRQSLLGIVALTGCRDFTAPGPVPASRRDLVMADSVVVVTPGSMNGWTLYDDQRGSYCTDATSCKLTDGPARPLYGTGSVELAVAATSAGNAIIRQGWQGIRLDRITQLSYATYRQSNDATNNLAIALQLNVDYDLRACEEITD